MWFLFHGFGFLCYWKFEKGLWTGVYASFVSLVAQHTCAHQTKWLWLFWEASMFYLFGGLILLSFHCCPGALTCLLGVGYSTVVFSTKVRTVTLPMDFMLVNGCTSSLLWDCGSQRQSTVFEGSWSPLLGPGIDVKTYRALCGEKAWIWGLRALFEPPGRNSIQSLPLGSSFLTLSRKASVASRNFRWKCGYWHRPAVSLDRCPLV